LQSEPSHVRLEYQVWRAFVTIDTGIWVEKKKDDMDSGLGGSKSGFSLCDYWLEKVHALL